MLERLTWRGTVNHKYKKLVRFVSHDFRLALALVEVVDSSDYDHLAKCLVAVTTVNDRVLPLVAELIKAEFRVNHAQPDTIFRLNSVASKVVGLYVRQVGGEYLKEIVGETVTQIVREDIALEIDPSRLKCPPDEVDAVVQSNRTKLLDLTLRLFHRLSSEDSVNDFPLPLRKIASYISESSREYSLGDRLYPLVGGFLMLRFFNPSIATPEAYGLLPDGLRPSSTSRRTLVLITKLLQNLSNNVEFKKETFMIPCNEFVKEHASAMQEYFLQVSTVDEPGALPEEPRPVVKRRPTRKSVWQIPGLSSLAGNANDADVNEPAEDDIDLKGTAVQDLIRLHHLIDRYGAKLVPCLQKMNLGDDTTGGDHAFVNLLKEIGPPPASGVGLPPPKEAPPEDRLDGLRDISYVHYLQNKDKFDTSSLERAQFLYRGAPNLEGHPVFYVIVNRIQPEHFNNIQLFIIHLFKTFGDALNEPYALCIDMSWATLDKGTQDLVYRRTGTIAHVFTRRHRKNLQAVYIVHPTSFASVVLWMMRAFTSEKLDKKIHEIYNWKQLRSFLPQSEILLPQESMDFIAHSYSVQKVNKLGKVQCRLIKFTPTSLLNIDPKTRQIKNEKLLMEIDEVNPDPAKPNLTMIFANIKGLKESPGFFPGDPGVEVRTYICRSTEERDEIVDMILSLSVNSDLSEQPMAFRVQKNGEAPPPPRARDQIHSGFYSQPERQNNPIRDRACRGRRGVCRPGVQLLSLLEMQERKPHTRVPTRQPCGGAPDGGYYRLPEGCCHASTQTRA
eukprot:Rmarinus@m.17318